MRPGIDVQAARPPQPAHQLRIDDAELQAKLIAHLVAPLELQRRWADNQHRPRTVAQDQLLDDEARLNRLAEAHIIGDEQIGAGHLDGAHDRVKLIVLNGNARAEGRLKGAHIGAGNRTPAHRIHKGVEAARSVEAGGLRQRGALNHLGTRLDLPDDLQLLADGVILDGGEGHAVLRGGVVDPKGIGWEGALAHLGDDVAALAHLDQLAVLGRDDTRHTASRSRQPANTLRGDRRNVRMG